MSETKHTPGKWRIDYPHVRADHTAARNEGRPHAIAYVCTNRRVFTSGEAKANAHLIAAAPELLELLKSARHGLASAEDHTDEWRSQCVPLLESIDAAIQKAEGGR